MSSASSTTSAAAASDRLSSYLRVPIRATLFSAATIAPMLFIVIAKIPERMMGKMRKHSSQFSHHHLILHSTASHLQEAAHAMLLVATCYTSLRAPLAALLTFRYQIHQAV